MPTFEMDAGNNHIVVTITLLARDGTLQPVVGNETVVFNFYDWYGALKITKAGAVSDQVNSKVACTLVSGDTSSYKGYILRAHADVTFADSSVITYPTIPDEYLLALY